MRYFVIDQDRRAVSGQGVNFKDPGFYGEEPFVTWLKLKQEDRLPDFLWGGDVTKPVFCVSDELKDILDNYACLCGSVPVFLTDEKYRNQKVYWHIDLQKQDCLHQDLYGRKEHQYLSSFPEDDCHMFQARNERVWYPVVSLELAENLLRRHVYGVHFYPIELWQGGEKLETIRSDKS